MNAIEFYSYRIPELRGFIQERGVNRSLRQKSELVRLCDVNDYKVMKLKRRTVKVNGVNVVMPSPTEVKS